MADNLVAAPCYQEPSAQEECLIYGLVYTFVCFVNQKRKAVVFTTVSLSVQPFKQKLALLEGKL